MASYNWKDYASAGLWERYLDAPLTESARIALQGARAYGLDYIQRARTLAREFGQPEPDEFEFILDLLLHARADPSQTHLAPIFGRNPAFDGLIALRASENWGEEGSALRCPRIFVSHRQQDYPEALRIAKIASDRGFQFWLDILDPTLTWLTTVGPKTFGPRQFQLLVAVVIEMLPTTSESPATWSA